MADINLRKSMGYAMNVEVVNQNFYHGLRERANSPIPPIFAKLYDGKKRFSYNPEKAKELLDKAIDIWTAAWGVGTAMDLNGLYAQGSAFNLSRMTTPKNDELIKNVNSIEALKDKDL